MFLWSCVAFQFLGAAGEDSSAARLREHERVIMTKNADNERHGAKKTGFIAVMLICNECNARFQKPEMRIEGRDFLAHALFNQKANEQ
jgi:hypothetical protein